MAGSMSALARTGATIAGTPSEDAAASITSMKNLENGDAFELNNTATRSSPL
jgi:hypothetical protein